METHTSSISLLKSDKTKSKKQTAFQANKNFLIKTKNNSLQTHISNGLVIITFHICSINSLTFIPLNVTVISLTIILNGR